MIRVGNTGFSLFSRTDQPHFTRQGALEVLQRCQTDFGAMSELRSLFQKTRGSATGMTDFQVLEAIAGMVEAQELILVTEAKYAISRGGGGGSAGANGGGTTTVGNASSSGEDFFAALEEAVLEPVKRAFEIPFEMPLKDLPIFPANLDVAAMAAALRTASQTAAAFCPT